MRLDLGNSPQPLTDGNTSWNNAVAPGITQWNHWMQRMQFSVGPPSPAPAASGDRINSVVFAPTVFGQSFGLGNLAVTITMRQGTVANEVDIVYNQNEVFDSYRGPLRIGANAFALPDIRRVFLHELGHALGLEHAGEDAIMNPFISDLELIAADDIAGAQSLYGAPPPVITSPLQAVTTVERPFVYQFLATGASSLSVTNLPPGLRFDAARNAILGQPTQAGTFSVGLSAPNAIGTTNATLVLVVQNAVLDAPVIASATSATGRTGRRFTFQVFTTGGTSAGRLSATNLPPGLTFDAVTGLISGSASQDGSFAVALTVTEGANITTSTLQLTFTSDPAIPVIISPNTASLSVGKPFLYTILAPAITSPGDITTFQVEGVLPSGLGFEPITGTISGSFTDQLDDREVGRDPKLSGGVISNVQLFATNSHGTTTIPLIFFLQLNGVANISTRLSVGAEPKVLIGGFIVTGNAPKKVIIRAIAPSLSVGGVPVSGTLPDPTLELVGDGLSVTNDDWRATQEQEIIDSTVPPANDRESAMIAILNPGAYTAVVRGKNGDTGIALIEVYDLGTASLDTSSSANLVNISTRGFVQTGDDVMIGGFIITGTTTRVIARAIGPDLANRGVNGALQDTMMEVRDGSGSLVGSNDDWESDHRQQIIDTTVAPVDRRESAVVANLPSGAYTAIIRGKDRSTGVALIEVFALPPLP
ncbi:MAG: putative Ig domain-containing protein [Chthoniobacterales bacterium]